MLKSYSVLSALNLSLCLFFASPVKAELKTKCSVAAYERAQKLYSEVKTQVDLGTLAPIEAMSAEVYLLEMKFCSGVEKMTVAEACKKIISAQNKVIDGEEKKYALGASTVKFVVEAQRRLEEYEASCGIK